MKIIFFGTPDYVLPILEKLHKHYEVIAVVTQPPRPVGRDKKLTYSAVDTWAHKKKIPILFDFIDFPKADIGILASYGELIPNEVISRFPLGILVIHPSLLPQFRWGSPIPATIVTGTNPTGITIFKMSEKWDNGPLLTASKEEVFDVDTTESLRERLFEKSVDILLEALGPYSKGKISLKPQDDSKASYARMIKKEDAFIPLNYLKNAMEINNSDENWEIKFIKNYSSIPNAILLDRFIRAMKPWPIAWTKVKIDDEELRLKLISSHIDKETGYLVLDEVHLEGKKPVSWKLFKSAYPRFTF